MKSIVPLVPLPVWKNLYSAAHEFKMIQPWRMLDDTDLVGVRDTSTGETGFGCVMGSGGIVFGLCLYRGAEGFNIHRRQMEEAVDPERDDIFAMQNCLKLEFGPRNDLQTEDRAVVQALGLSFKGVRAWPEFRGLVPGYAPWFLTDAEARFLTLGLQTVRHHIERVERGEANESMRERECLVYSSAAERKTESAGEVQEPGQAQWEPWPAPVHQPFAPPVLNLARLNALRTKKLKPDSPWEASVFYLPSTILDRELPYYVRLAAVCQQSSGFSFAAETLPPEQSLHQALVDTICSSIERHGFLPDTIFVKDAEEAAALTPLAKTLGLSIRRRKHLNTIQMLKKDMMETIVWGGRR